MKKEKNKLSTKNKRILPLLSSIALLSGPVLLVVSCNHDIMRYSTALPNNQQNRILFDFVGVNYNVNAKSQFSANFKQGMEFIKKDIEGIMAKQEFYNFFTQKLNYTEEKAIETFNKIKDTISRKLLADDYFNTINNGESFDSKVYKTKLIFQTENWHIPGTIKFNYNSSDFYKDPKNNPDKLFTPTNLYSNLDDTKIDEDIQRVAKHIDDIEKLTNENLTWDNSSTTPEHLPPPLVEGENAIQDYQKKLERYEWWLYFRYQEYLRSVILPQVNEALFVMANIINSILKITTIKGETKVEIDNSKYAIQLQDWGPNSAWTSKYRLVWDYTTDQNSAASINRDWNKNPLPDLMKNDGKNITLNSDFLNRLASTDKNLKNTIDPIIGINSFIKDTVSKDYDKSVKSNNISNWAKNNDGTYYWGKNNKGSFAYSAPIYWIDVIQNLNFNFYNNPNKNNSITVNTSDDYKGLISSWNNAENSATSNSDFSKYIRQDNISTLNDKEYSYYQEMKWNTFWQMLYFLASQADTNSNKDIAKENFTTAAKVLYPKYIKKEKIYSEEFWNAINSYY